MQRPVNYYNTEITLYITLNHYKCFPHFKLDCVNKCP